MLPMVPSHLILKMFLRHLFTIFFYQFHWCRCFSPGFRSIQQHQLLLGVLNILILVPVPIGQLFHTGLRAFNSFSNVELWPLIYWQFFSMKLNPLFSFLMLQIVMLTVCFELDLNQFHCLCTDAICQFFGCCLYNVECLENEINRVQMLQVKSRPSMFKSSCRLPYEKQISKKERKLAHSICKWFCLSRFISSVDDLALKSIICM